MQGTDISAPALEAELGGERMALRFDHNQMRMSEIYYQTTTLRKLGYLGIVDQAISRTYIGLGAIAYGAAASAAMAQGALPPTMHDFDGRVTYDELRACARALLDGIMESMPKSKAKNG